MTNTQNHLSLFTDVKDGLPEDAHLLFHIKMKYMNSILYGFYSKKDLCFYIYYREGLQKIAGHHSVTHYLDLNSLTTKVKAIQLAEESYEKGWDDNFKTKSNEGKKAFIQEKQKEL